MKIIAGRILSGILVGVTWLFLGVRVALDLVGYSTSPEDLGVARSRLVQALDWLFTVPWWAALCCAAITTLALIWASWPKERTSQLSPTVSGASDVATQLQVVSNQKFEKAPVRIDGLKFINCEFRNVLITWDGGPYAFENSALEPAFVDGFQTGSSYVRDALHLFGRLGLLHPKGVKEMGIPIDPTDAFLLDRQIPPNDRATLKLHLRPGQEPLEISKENIWRWFVFQTRGVDAKKPNKTKLIHTTYFLVFDRPIKNSYYLTHCSTDGIRFSVVDYTSRSAVITVDGEHEGAVVEFTFSANPL